MSKLDTIIEEIAGLTVLELSELVKALEEKFGVSAAMMAAPAAAAAPAVRTARYPSTSSTPERCGGTSTAASSNDPTMTAADTSPTAVAAGRPY
ncbi:hypothetical protein EO238_25000, partial [Citrobacter sp. AAK_AS5]